MIAEDAIARDRVARAHRNAELYRLRRQVRGSARARAARALRRVAGQLDHAPVTTATPAFPATSASPPTPSVLHDAA